MPTRHDTEGLDIEQTGSDGMTLEHGDASAAPLVSITKLRPPSFERNRGKGEKTGEIIGFSRKNESFKKNGARDLDERFVRYQMQSAAKHILPNHRVGICLRHQIEAYGDVDIFKHRETQKAFYGGLMVCGSVWACPVCASKISERRRQELKVAFKTHLDAGGFCTMVTLTFSHSARDKLTDMLVGLGKAMQIFSRGKRHDNFRKEIGLIGKIRAFEITYGGNGWHPHIHLLLMHEKEIDPWEFPEFEDKLYSMWSGACAKSGLETSREHGLKMHDAAEASTYIGKWGDIMDKPWGTDSEMTKSNIKKGREGNITPFDMLRVIVNDGDLEYESKFREYVLATKGKQQLVWSPGLKNKYCIDEKTDEEVSLEKIEEADLLGRLSWQEWKFILHKNLRYELLKEIEIHGYERAIINIFKKNKPTYKTDELVPLAGDVI